MEEKSYFYCFKCSLAWYSIWIRCTSPCLRSRSRAFSQSSHPEFSLCRSFSLFLSLSLDSKVWWLSSTVYHIKNGISHVIYYIFMTDLWELKADGPYVVDIYPWEEAKMTTNLGALTLRPPTNRPRDIPTHTIRPPNIPSTVTIYYCDNSTP